MVIISLLTFTLARFLFFCCGYSFSSSTLFSVATVSAATVFYYLTRVNQLTSIGQPQLTLNARRAYLLDCSNPIACVKIISSETSTSYTIINRMFYFISLDFFFPFSVKAQFYDSW